VNLPLSLFSYQSGMQRAPRLAMMMLPSLDHFTADLLARLPAASGWEVRKFLVTRPGIDGRGLDLGQ
jgi:hypothetical protein